MCGIAGILNKTGEPVDPSLPRLMIDRLAHRGPDECGIHLEGSAGLAHARLSIIDLARGQQPMANEDRSLWVTFNGEIFNYLELREELAARGHRFETRSDTEVILHAFEEYGESCVTRFNGQWALAIWDRRTERLFLSRDRLGVRPLFYLDTASRFAFASEAKALLALPGVSRTLDPIGLDQIFTFWTTLSPRTVFKEIRELPPGHSMTVDRSAIRPGRYWSLNYAPDDSRASDAEALADELRDLLADATKIRLRADVPVGAYLSGGLDSTVITSFIRASASVQLKTFSIAFDDQAFDESRYQREASQFLDTEHEEVRCSSRDIAQVFPSMIWHAETPVLRSAPAPLFLLSKLVHDRRYKVVLTGEGADEMLGGYDIFKEAKVRRFWASQPASVMRPRLLKRLYPYLGALQNQSDAYLKSFFKVGDTSDPLYSHMPRWAMTSGLKAFFSEDIREATRDYNPYEDLRQQLPAAYPKWDGFAQAQYLEATLLLPGYILSSQGDRMAMAHSVEGRFPFLDHRVVDFASRLPPSLKMKVLNEKYLLKRASRGLVPPSIAGRSKQPYRAPDASSFFTGPVEPYVEELLSADRIRRAGLFDPAATARLVQKCRTGKALGARDNMAFVGVLSTSLVVDQFVETLGERHIDGQLRERPAPVHRREFSVR